MEFYVAGYLSARAVSLGTDHLKAVTMDGVDKEIDRQCSLRPSLRLVDISLIIAHELEGQ